MRRRSRRGSSTRPALVRGSQSARARASRKCCRAVTLAYDGEWGDLDHLPHLLLDPVGDRVGLREHEVADEDPGAVLERGDEVLEDLDALAVRPVVQDEAEEVGVRAPDGLRLEEVVCHELHPAAVLLLEGPLGVLHLFLVEILDDELPNLGVVGYLERGMAA